MGLKFCTHEQKIVNLETQVIIKKVIEVVLIQYFQVKHLSMSGIVVFLLVGHIEYARCRALSLVT